MELTVRFDEQRDGAVHVNIHRINGGRISLDAIDLIEAAIFESINECVRRGFLDKVRVYWDGATFRLPRKQQDTTQHDKTNKQDAG